MLTTVAILFFLFLFINVPVAFALALATIPAFLFTDYMPMTVAIQRMYGATLSFPLLAVPFFILAGNLMNTSGITERLLRFARLLTGWMAGGLAQVSIVLSALMGGISGAAVADAAMEARILGPTMAERGYDKGFTAAVIAFSSVITATIPPSIGLILFGFISEVSIGRLLLGGVVPGLLMMATLMTVTSIIAHKRGYKPELPARPTFRELAVSFRQCFWALVFPVFLLVGFRFGFFTATEAGAVVVVYALVIGVVVYREMTVRSLIEALNHSVVDIGMVMLIIIMAAVLGHAITIEQAPAAITGFLTEFAGHPYLTLLAVLLILFVAGMVMEATVNVLLLTPLLLPALVAQGFDPVHVGVVMIIIATSGGNTPPVGVIMYTVCGIIKCSFAEFVRWSWPFILAMAILITALALVPDLVLFLPDHLM
ncbi:TRAP transporter large permease [Bauldia litoralis]|uniref:TRAP transporter large permease protein n=1 Tax=Bauldia litoralis TaxID=665467 RepID=A0A1G6CPB1_9HYPH|nr:TRAP transporter large permease [Bauldia litoralis]SDB34723.1 TRAP transporter, DctM subunit [Bauldia litoralis]